MGHGSGRLGKRWDGLRERCIEKLGEERARDLLQMYMDGVPIADIVSQMGLKSPQCIYAIIGVPTRRGPYKKRSKITPNIESKILRLRARGLTMLEIAVKLGISVGSVHKILKKHMDSSVSGI